MPIPADYRELPSFDLDPRRVEALSSFHPSSDGKHLVLPDGRMDLIARYRLTSRDQIEQLHLTIIGPSQCPLWVSVAEGDRFLGIRFRAGWGGVTLNVDPSELRDSSLAGKNVDAVLGTNCVRLRAAKTEDDLRTALLAAACVSAASSHHRKIARQVVVAIDVLHLTGGRLNLPDLACASGMPERTLRREVTRAVGLSIKSLAAVLRFQRTVRLLANATDASLTLAQAALEGGYSDQAHMTREFQRYGGFTPGRRPPVALGSLPL
ncbi:MAG: helix-turn-helix domain-containing protein [Hyphomicrobium sp.]|nr:helix-turn-helix domain-containing protein [Hyphomicrobium sp.]